MPALRKRLLQMVMMVLLAGLSGLLSCAPAPAAVEIAADGALQIPARDSEIRLRAYRPDVEIILAWKKKRAARFK